MARPAAEPVIHIDDDRFRVTEWRFPPGAETGWHVHGHDYVVVPITEGTLHLEEPGGTSRDAPLTLHGPYTRRAGVEHNVINDGQAPVAFIEVEVVDDGLRGARLVCLERFMAAWNAHDLDALMACMAEDCAFVASGGGDAAGERHEGPAAVRAAFAAIFERFPDAAWGEARHAVSGDGGVSRWRFTGTGRDGARVAADGCDLFEFSGELIALKDSYRKAGGG